jgi:hypothetical protein
MAVRYSAESQTHSRTVSLGSVSALTLAAWVKVSVDRNTNQVWASLDNGNTSYWAVGTNADGITAQAFAHNAASGNGLAMTVGSWFYVALSENGVNGNMWMRPLGSATWTTVTWSTFGTPITGTDLRLGRHPAAGLWFNGCLAAIKVWTAALTLTEVQAESNQYAPIRTTDLRAYYPMTTTSTADSSGSGWTLSGGTGSTTEAGPSGIPLGTDFSGWGVPIF